MPIFNPSALASVPSASKLHRRAHAARLPFSIFSDPKPTANHLPQMPYARIATREDSEGPV